MSKITSDGLTRSGRDAV